MFFILKEQRKDIYSATAIANNIVQNKVQIYYSLG